jgi:hypothetical protein
VSDDAKAHAEIAGWEAYFRAGGARDDKEHDAVVAYGVAYAASLGAPGSLSRETVERVARETLKAWEQGDTRPDETIEQYDDRVIAKVVAALTEKGDGNG